MPKLISEMRQVTFAKIISKFKKHKKAFWICAFVVLALVVGIMLALTPAISGIRHRCPIFYDPCSRTNQFFNDNTMFGAMTGWKHCPTACREKGFVTGDCILDRDCSDINAQIPLIQGHCSDTCKKANDLFHRDVPGCFCSESTSEGTTTTERADTTSDSTLNDTTLSGTYGIESSTFVSSDLQST